MLKYKRFPVPEFNRDELKDLAWQAPSPLAQDEIDRLIEKRNAGDASVYGAYAVMPGEALFDKFAFRGEHRHALMCLLPDGETTVIGRSWAWPIQGAKLVDSLDPEGCSVIADWRSMRPMNTRLGPEDGIEVGGGVLYALMGHRYADHWIANRTIVQGDWAPASGGDGFRIVSSSDDDLDDFHDCVLSFQWGA